MKTILDIISLSTEYFLKCGFSNPRREAEELVAEVLKLKRLDLYLQFERPLTTYELALCRDLLKRRASKEPWQYIRGEVLFFDATIKVSPDVLIPRQETEILVDRIAKNLKSDEPLESKMLWDICCGSGCIAISLKKAFPHLNVEMADLSEKALQQAQINCLTNEVMVKCYLSNLMDAFNGQQADYIVVNPPYISNAEYSHLEPEVKNFEPKMALVSGPTGLEFYERLSIDLKKYLKIGGKAYLEIGSGQGNSIKKIFENEGWIGCFFEQDWAGHDRFFFIEKD